MTFWGSRKDQSAVGELVIRTNDKWGDENKYMSCINYLELQVLNEYDITWFYLVSSCQLHIWEFLIWRFIAYYIGVGYHFVSIYFHDC